LSEESCLLPVGQIASYILRGGSLVYGKNQKVTLKFGRLTKNAYLRRQNLIAPDYVKLVR
jgi:hypothetical protein